MLYYQCTVEHLKQCQFAEWYPKYKHCSIKSYIIDVPVGFIEWIKEDGINIQEGVKMFPTLVSSINETMKKFDNNDCFVKLNWTAPMDALYVGIKCKNSKDVLTIIKCSELLNQDIYSPYQYCIDGNKEDNKSVYIVLREWIDMNAEYRIFVYHNKLMGICQRDKSRFKGDQIKIKSAITNWYDSVFGKEFLISSFILDICFYAEKILLVDINVWNETTKSSYLFTWNELIHTSTVLFKVNECDILQNDYGDLSVPMDFMEYKGDLAKMMEDSKAQLQN